MTTELNIKTLYVFSVPVTKEVEEPVVTQDDQGNEIKGTRKIAKEIHRRVALRKPTRALLDDAELYFNVLVSKGIEAGLMTRALLAKRFNNDGGVLSQPEKVAYSRAYNELETKERDFVRLTALKNKSSLSEEENKTLEVLQNEIAGLRRALQELEMSQLALYDITAESRARTKTILWWLLHLTYVEDLKNPDNFVPVFQGETIEELMDSYDAIEESDNLNPEDKAFFYKAIRRAAAATAFWFYGRASKQEDFLTLESQINQETTDVVPSLQKLDNIKDAEPTA